LCLSPKTAIVHVTAILHKLKASNRAHAAAITERLHVTDVLAPKACGGTICRDLPMRVRMDSHRLVESPPGQTFGEK